MTFQNKFIPANSAQISLLPLQKVQIYPAIFAKMKKKFKVWFQKFVRITNFQDVKVSNIEFLGSEYLNSIANFDSILSFSVFVSPLY